MLTSNVKPPLLAACLGICLGVCLAFCFVPAVFPQAAGGLTAAQILSRVDAALNAPRDRCMEARLILIDRNGNRQERVIEMLQKGADRRLARFLAPPDQKGISVLSLPGGVIYLYLPAYKKVKRIAGHVKNSRFAGTDYSYADLEAKNYSDHYTPTLIASDGDYWLLELLPLPGADSDYARLRMWVDSDTFITFKTEFYDRGDMLTKRLTSSRIELIDGYWTPREHEMQDLIREHRTLMVMSDIRFDTGLEDSLFSQRTLERQ
jgi:outer membrane lipoprotein-sorting protein